MAFNEQDKVVEDIFLSLRADDINNVTFQLSDGRTEANKTILSIRSEYFKTMFQSQFREKTSDVIEMPYQKTVFDQVILFLYTGNLQFSPLSLAELLQLENVLSLMMLENAVKETRDYVSHSTRQGGFTLAEATKALDLTYEFALETSKQNLLNFLNENLSETSKLIEFLQLPSKILKDLLVKTKCLSYHRLSGLVCWLEEEGNSLEAEDIQTLRDSFSLQHFSAHDLVGLVRKSNIFSPDLIIEALSNVIKKKDESLALMTARVTSLELQDLEWQKTKFDTNFCRLKFGGEILSKLNTHQDFWVGNGLGSQDILVTLSRPRKVNKVRFFLKTRLDLIVGYSIFHLPQLHGNIDDEIIELSHCLVNNSDKDVSGVQEVYFKRLVVSNIVIRLNIGKRHGLEYGLLPELGALEYQEDAGTVMYTDDGYIDVSLCSFSENVYCKT